MRYAYLIALLCYMYATDLVTSDTIEFATFADKWGTTNEDKQQNNPYTKVKQKNILNWV